MKEPVDEIIDLIKKSLNEKEVEYKLPCNMIFAGNTNSGKTFLCKRILREQLIGQIDCLVILSTTNHLSKDFDEYKENNDPKKGLLVYKHSTNFKQVVDELVQQAEHLFNNYAKDDIPSTLLILDDMVGNPLLTLGGTIDSLATRARHLKISIAVLVQKLTAVPRTFRLNAKYYFILNATQFSEIERFCTDLVPRRLKKKMMKYVSDLFDVEYTFLLVNCHNPKISERLYLNGTFPLYGFLNRE